MKQTTKRFFVTVLKFFAGEKIFHKRTFFFTPTPLAAENEDAVGETIPCFDIVFL